MSTTVRADKVPPAVAPADGGGGPGPLARFMRLPIDPLLLLAAVGIGVCSVVTLKEIGNGAAGSASYYVVRQSVYLAIGVALMLVVSRFDYSVLRNYPRPIYAFLLLSLLAVRAVGSSANGSVRAIQFPLFSFQASEIGKVLLILSLSGFFVERLRFVRDRRNTALLLALTVVAALLVMIQPDIGSSLVYLVIAVAILFIGGVPGRHLATLLGLAAVVASLVLVAAPAAGVHLLKRYQEERLTAFLHPTRNAQKQGYQQQMSQIAIGSGGRTGSKAATQTALNFVPEAHTDFIFASVGERFGFVGAAVVLSLFALLIWRILRVVTMARDLFGATIAGGVVAMVLFQLSINVGMTVGISPITGIPLPLMSYGGSSVVSTMLALGLVQAVYARARAGGGGRAVGGAI